MTSTADQKMLDRIAKLLRQAEDAELGDRPAEATAFQDKAFALMATHGVSEAMARARLDGLNITDEAKAASVYVHFVGTYQRMQAELFWQLCAAMHCQAIMLGKGNTLRVYGMADHLTRLQSMWELLAPQAQRGMANAHPGPGASSAEVANFRRNWLEGFANQINARILKAEDAAAAAEGALALYKSDQQRADEAMHTDYPHPGSVTISRGFNVDGYDQGGMAGSAAQLHRSVTS
jgi:Protein of unknown function (DUF2786)